MLRITVIHSSKSVVRLRVEGRLTGRSVEELRQACELHTRGDGMQLILDLEDISFADSHGVEILNSLKRHNVTLLNLLPFMALQLHESDSAQLPLHKEK
jgi:anti-anti-sigma factor